MSSVLVDASIWRRFFAGCADAHTARTLEALLDEDGAVLIHPAVIGELVLGGLSAREERLLAHLPSASEVSNAELLEFVRYRKLQRRGIGWVDCRLLASAAVADAALWALDHKLAAAAADLKLAFTAA